jgi:hypothetical protein
MRQPQISYLVYLEPAVTRFIDCHFGQLVHTCHVCMNVMDMNNQLVQTPIVSNNS